MITPQVSENVKQKMYFKISKCVLFENDCFFFIVWDISGLLFGLLATRYVESSAPDLKRHPGAELPGDRFFFYEHRYESRGRQVWLRNPEERDEGLTRPVLNKNQGPHIKGQYFGAPCPILICAPGKNTHLTALEP